MKKNFEVLAEDENVDGIRVVDLETNEEVVNIEKASFEKFTTPNEFFQTDQRDEIDEHATLLIKRPDFYPKSARSKWEFFYKGRSIKTGMKDVKFNKKIEEGLRIGKGDRLLVVLKKIMKYDSKWEEYLESGFEVVQVKEIIYKAQKPDLFGSPEKKD